MCAKAVVALDSRPLRHSHRPAYNLATHDPIHSFSSPVVVVVAALCLEDAAAIATAPPVSQCSTLQ